MTNREIKFRAWDEKNKKIMYFVNLLYYIGKLVGIQHEDLISDGYPGEYPNYAGNGKAEEYKIMQYTGLKDKNGKEIYEGDILFQKYRNKIRVILVRELSAYGVIFNCPHLNFYRDIVNKESLEVIGNIYENPDLLEAKDE